MSQLSEHYSYYNRKNIQPLGEWVTTSLKYIDFLYEKSLIILRKRDMKLYTMLIFFKCSTKQLQETCQNGGMTLLVARSLVIFSQLYFSEFWGFFFQQAHTNFMVNEICYLELGSQVSKTADKILLKPMMQLAAKARFTVLSLPLWPLRTIITVILICAPRCNSYEQGKDIRNTYDRTCKQVATHTFNYKCYIINSTKSH